MKKEWLRMIPVVVLLLGVHVYLGSMAIQSFAPTYDEPVHAASGFVYLKTGDYRMNGLNHPPFGEMWTGLPWIFMNAMLPVHHPIWQKQHWLAVNLYHFANIILYKNRIDADLLMTRARQMQQILSVLLGLGLFFAGLTLGGPLAGLLSLGLWAFSPTILAHGTLASTDFSFIVFFFFFYLGLTISKNWKSDILVGLCLGLSMASKYFAVPLLPLLLLIFLWERIINKKKFGTQILIRGAGVAAVAFFTLLVVYRFENIGMYFRGLNHFSKLVDSGRSSYFLGQHGTEGWIWYFPVAFLLKTPLPILIGFTLSLILFFKKKYRLPSSLIIPPLVFFMMTCFSKVQIGHRHILLIYPFLFLFIGMGLSHLKKKWLFLNVFLMGWLGLETFLVAPHYLPYFNAFIGGPAQGYRYFTDSNVDWGQGLKELGQSLSDEDKEKGIFLCYFGVGDPNHYGIRYIDTGSYGLFQTEDDRSHPGLSPTKFAISATNYQATYYANKGVFQWLKSKKPVQTIAHTIFLYDFKGDEESLHRLRAISRYSGSNHET